MCLATRNAGLQVMVTQTYISFSFVHTKGEYDTLCLLLPGMYTWPALLHSQEGEAGGRAQAGNALHQLAGGCDAQQLLVDQLVSSEACYIGQGKGYRPGQPTQKGGFGHI